MAQKGNKSKDLLPFFSLKFTFKELLSMGKVKTF